MFDFAKFVELLLKLKLFVQIYIKVKLKKKRFCDTLLVVLFNRLNSLSYLDYSASELHILSITI